MKRSQKIILAVLAALNVAAVALFSVPSFKLCRDGTVNGLLSSLIPAACAFALLSFAVSVYDKSLLIPPRHNILHKLLWCLPLLGVALANFPFSALVTKTAVVLRAELVPLLALSCIFTGMAEELFFRATVITLLFRYLPKKAAGEIPVIFISSALFSVWHLFNILTGAPPAAALLQAGYAFLTGCMLAAAFMRTRNVWICAALHAVFNFGGTLVPALGEGAFQDIAFWITTGVAAVLCAAHIIAYYVKRAAS